MPKKVYWIISLTLLSILTTGMSSNAEAMPVSSDKDTQTSEKPEVYAYYYLWWSAQHWKDKLGPNYPYTASPLPLPATTDADGCNAVSNYLT